MKILKKRTSFFCKFMQTKGLQTLSFVFFGSLLVFQCSKANAPDLRKEPHLKIAHIFDESGALLLALKELKIAAQNQENPKGVQEFQKALSERRKKAAITLADLQIALKNQMERHRYHRFYYQTGICYEILGQKDQALFAYTKSLSLRPLPLSYVQRALFFLGTGQTRPAKQDLQSALGMEKDYPRAVFYAGLLLAMTQQNQKAASFAERLNSRRPRYAAVLKYYVGHPEHARRMLKEKPPSILDFPDRQTKKAQTPGGKFHLSLPGKKSLHKQITLFVSPDAPLPFPIEPAKNCKICKAGEQKI